MTTPAATGPQPWFLGKMGLPVSAANAAKIEGALIGAVVAQLLGVDSSTNMAIWSGAMLGYAVMSNAAAPPVTIPVGLSLPLQAQLEGAALGVAAGYTLTDQMGSPMVVGAAAGAFVRSFI